MRRARLLHSVRVLEYKNDFPIALGVSISCCPVREMTRCGSGYAFSCLPNHVNCTPLELYTNEACTEDSLNWRMHYPEYNVNNLSWANFSGGNFPGFNGQGGPNRRAAMAEHAADGKTRSPTGLLRSARDLHFNIPTF